MSNMDKDKDLNRKPASLLLRAMFMGLAVVASNAAMAEGSFLLDPSFNALKEGDVMLAPIGQQGAGVRMSMDVPGQDQAGASRVSNNGIWLIDDNASEVHMSFVIPW